MRNGVLYPRVALASLRPETTGVLFRSDEPATHPVAYPTPPVPDNMTRDG